VSVVVCGVCVWLCFFFFSSRRRHTRCLSDWSSDVCSSDLDSQVCAVQLLLRQHPYYPLPRCLVEKLFDIVDETEDLLVINKPAGDRKRRRVGKECRSRWEREQGREKRADTGMAA